MSKLRKDGLYWNEGTHLQYTACLITMLPFFSLHLTQILVLLSNFSLPTLRQALLCVPGVNLRGIRVSFSPAFPQDDMVGDMSIFGKRRAPSFNSVQTCPQIKMNYYSLYARRTIDEIETNFWPSI